MKPDPLLPLDQQQPRVVFRMNLWAEARGEQDHGGRLESLAMLAVGCVVMNRAKAKGKTPMEIILARLQFSWTRPVDPNHMKVLRADTIDPISWERADTVADLIEAGAVTDTTDGATHYYNAKLATPDWGRGHPGWVEKVVIGNHVFGRAA